MSATTAVDSSQQEDSGANTPDLDVVVVGAGMAGLYLLYRLRSMGLSAIALEAADDVGGTWYWNRYPGIACDIESYTYLPLLEEVEYIPKEKYSFGPEILAHSQTIARKFDLYRDVCFQTRVTELRWDEDEARWTLSTNRGDRMKAHYVCLATGPLNRPKLPGIPGIEDFEGHSFHASRWDYEYTGGDADGGLTGLRDKRVGIIGTGATAVQCVPHVGASAEHLYVFQRTPSSIDVKNNDPTDPEWARGLKSGWHKRRMENFQLLVSGAAQEEDLVGDGWTDIARNLLSLAPPGERKALSSEELAAKQELADFLKMESIRSRVDSVVKDAAVAESLKPYFRLFCKRPCYHNEYLETFNRPNVTLVDTRGAGVDRITEKGIVFDGKEYELDCLIFASGFEVGTHYTRRSRFEVTGRDGLTLGQKWKDGVRTLYGMHVHGFPNCFVMSLDQTGFTVNFPYILNEQATHIAHVISRALGEDIESIEASQDAEAGWVDAVVERAQDRRSFLADCTPSYFNNEGVMNRKTYMASPYFGEPGEFERLLEEWRTEGSMKGLRIRHSATENEGHERHQRTGLE